MTELKPTKATLAAIEAAKLETTRPEMSEAMLGGKRHEDMTPLGQLPPSACHIALLMDDIDAKARAKSQNGTENTQEKIDYLAAAKAFTEIAGEIFPALLKQETLIQFEKDWHIGYKPYRPRQAAVLFLDSSRVTAATIAAALSKERR